MFALLACSDLLHYFCAALWAIGFRWVRGIAINFKSFIYEQLRNRFHFDSRFV